MVYDRAIKNTFVDQLISGSDKNYGSLLRDHSIAPKFYRGIAGYLSYPIDSIVTTSISWEQPGYTLHGSSIHSAWPSLQDLEALRSGGTWGWDGHMLRMHTHRLGLD